MGAIWAILGKKIEQTMSWRASLGFLSGIWVLPLAVAVHAEPELFPTTEARPWQPPAAVSRWLTNRPAPADVEPAAGQAESGDSGANTHNEGGHDEGGHGDGGHGESNGDAHGEASKSKHGKSASGKDLDGPQPLPEVRIGGELVLRHVDAVADAELSSTPINLQQRGIAQLLMRRIGITPFAHNPRRGRPDAPVQVVLMEDLNCTACWPAMMQIDVALQDYASTTQVIWVHTPSEQLQPTNMAAFYAKAAAKMGKFWDYRANLLTAKPKDTQNYFDLLTQLGIDPRTTRQIMLTDARRFYREIDADTQLVRNFGFNHPPMVLVNGIVVGKDGLPLDLLPDVLAYVHNRIAHGLIEPPK
jgi:protein-disulfide isomerase